MKRHILKSKDLSPIILGEYDFKNHYFINIDTPPMLSTQTTIHEAFHMISVFETKTAAVSSKHCFCLLRQIL